MGAVSRWKPALRTSRELSTRPLTCSPALLFSDHSCLPVPRRCGPHHAPPSSSLGPSCAVTADAILDKWREYEIARLVWSRCRRVDASYDPMHACRVAQREKIRKKRFDELTSMIDNSDLETAKAALGCLSRYRVQTLGDIDKIHAQYSASRLERLEDAVDARGGIIQHLVDHIVKTEPVSLAWFHQSCDCYLTLLTRNLPCCRSRRGHCRIATRGSSEAGGAAGCRRSGGGVPVSGSGRFQDSLGL